MAETMIERIARAAFYRYFLELPRTGDADPDTVWSEVATERHRKLWRDIMRAAIEATQEPTNEMVDHAWRTSEEGLDPRRVFRAMMQFALNEPPADSSPATQESLSRPQSARD